MFKFLRKLFRKKQVPKKLELTEDLIISKYTQRTHRFFKFDDKHYCTIMGFHSNEYDGVINLDIAWRCKRKVDIGDTFIIHNGSETKTLRIRRILDNNSDVKIGIAVSLQ